MDPHLENVSLWQDFHQSFLPMARESLSAQIAPRYVVKIEEHLYIHHPSEPEERAFAGRTDVAVTRGERSSARASGAAVMEAPAHVRIPPITEVERVGYLEIRDRDRRQLVTVLELLSPSNKRPGADRDQYMNKRDQLLASDINFIEIDLLRGGPRLPWRDMRPCDYYAVVSRVEDRPDAGLWPIQLRDPLPKIPVPLRGGEQPAYLDLQKVLDRVYDAAGYRHYVYETEPEPPLAPADAAWARQLLPGTR
jgi:hypothetical protein